MSEILGINKIIFNDISNCLETYGVDENTKSKLQHFLRLPPSDYPNRQKSAQDLVKSILHSHGKAQLSEEIAILGEIEEHVRPIQNKLRDHVIHAVLTFILGIYLIEKLHLKDNITTFEWKLTSLLHDIAYPYEIAFYLTEKIENHINGMAVNHKINTPVLKTSNTVVNLEKLARKPSSLSLLTKRFRNWGFKFSARKLYEKMKSDNKVDHGKISSLLLLKSMDILYERYNKDRVRSSFECNGYNWDYRIFENQIVNSCASIFIHNLPSELFRNNKLKVKKHALPFILRLSDELQDWERITRNSSFYSGEIYSISKDHDCIVFKVPKSRLEKIRNSMSCFEDGKIIIMPTNAE